MNTKDWSPWYVIGWRLIWIVPVVVASGILLSLIFITYGPTSARRLWKDLA